MEWRSAKLNKNNIDENLDEIKDEHTNETNECSENQCECDTKEKETTFEPVDVKKIKEENEKLKKEVEELKERQLRISAEYDNYRKRTIKEKQDVYLNAYEDVLKEMFEVLDNLERALSCDSNLEDLRKGIEMTVKQFNTSLEKLEVEEIDTNGEFDPNYHNAVMHEENDSVGANQIVEVFLKGYKKGEKVLRYSMVKVAN
ncbi:nucleotide exchange factor GrpE [Clostridium senegalense]|uniref:nucleotide exchange factor GrpE n=1 Tax=Clostridium senegalense TaxID=1465809 RepID=UPI00047468F4|nr:nucleotide exchange factor GrpE [Clostridium senegalense]MBU5225474.1 nucleotide exchange factor GrpE [Clostridium senegalense]